MDRSRFPSQIVLCLFTRQNKSDLESHSRLIVLSQRVWVVKDVIARRERIILLITDMRLRKTPFIWFALFPSVV